VVVNAEVNETNKTTPGSERRSLLKNCLTGPTLLEMSVYRVNQELNLISRRNRSNRSALVVSLPRSPELMIRNRFNLPFIPCGLPTRNFRNRKIAGVGNKCRRAMVSMEETR
jgi:hypothetical protein